MVSVKERHSILQNIGVTQWYSRCLLANSANTPKELLVKENAVLESVVAIGDTRDSANEKSIGKLLSGAQEISSVISELTTNDDESSGSSTPGRQQDEKQHNDKPVVLADLALSVLKYDNLIVFYETQKGSEDLERALLSSILGSLKQVKNHSIGFENIHTFVWPPFNGQALRHCQSKYFDSCLHSLLNSLDFTAVNRVLYFGLRFGLVEDMMLEYRLQQKAEFIIQPLEVSLYDLLAVPIKKKGLWSVLARVGLAS